jgi:hypothetical protein
MLRGIVALFLLRTLLIGHVFDLSDYRFLKIKGELTGVKFILKGKVGNLLIIEGTEVFESVKGDTFFLFIRKKGESIFSRLGILKRDVKISLPRELPFSLNLELRGVSAEFRFGRTSPKTIELTVGPGRAKILFDSPLLTELEKFSLSLSLASVSIEKLGNSRVEETQIDCGAGKISIDLGGEWKGNSKIYLFSTLGSLRILSPPGLGLRIRKRGFLNFGESLIRDGTPTIIFEIEGSLNSLMEVIRG